MFHRLKILPKKKSSFCSIDLVNAFFFFFLFAALLSFLTISFANKSMSKVIEAKLDYVFKDPLFYDDKTLCTSGILKLEAGYLLLKKDDFPDENFILIVVNPSLPKGNDYSPNNFYLQKKVKITGRFDFISGNTCWGFDKKIILSKIEIIN